MENLKFIFDIDGTLTPSRRKIDPDFHEYFLDFTHKNDVYLVTGSNREKTIEQIGESLFNACKRVYNALVMMFMRGIRMFIELHGNFQMKDGDSCKMN